MDSKESTYISRPETYLTLVRQEELNTLYIELIQMPGPAFLTLPLKIAFGSSPLLIAEKPLHQCMSLGRPVAIQIQKLG